MTARFRSLANSKIGIVNRIFLRDPDVVGVDLDVAGTQLVKAALQLRNHLVRVVRSDKGHWDESVGRVSDELGYQVIAAAGLAVENAVDAGTVDPGPVEGAEEELDIVVHPEAAPASDVAVKIDDRSFH